MGLADWFRGFCSNLAIPSDKRSNISSRYKKITKRLNTDFWSSGSEDAHSLFVGSYGRGTAINSFSDLDMLFELPNSVYHQYNSYSLNGQSALLQAVKAAIEKTYSVTNISADGQIVEVPFDDGITFEIVPCFANKDGESFTYPDSNAGGSWKVTNPKSEINAISFRDKKLNGNLKHLCRMTRSWKKKRKVPMGGLLIDTLAYKFLETWEYNNKTYVYYDWMSRDFFKYLMNEDDTKSYWLAVGSNQRIYRLGNFSYKAKICYNLSLEAIEDEKDYPFTAKKKWREIYGTKFSS